MPRVPVPDEVSEFLSRPNAAVVATLRPDGSPHTAATWYDWEDGRVLLNMDESRLRLQFLRRDPRASLTAIDLDNWYRHVSLTGRVVSIDDDVDLADIRPTRSALHGPAIPPALPEAHQRAARARTLARLERRRALERFLSSFRPGARPRARSPSRTR